MLNDDLKAQLGALREDVLGNVEYMIDGMALRVRYDGAETRLKLDLSLADAVVPEEGGELELLKGLSDNPDFFDNLSTIVLADIAQTYGEAVEVLQGVELKK